jgi:thymidylate kinase
VQAMPKKQIVLVEGFVGAGKSTVCNALAEQGFTVRDNDTFSQKWIKEAKKHNKTTWREMVQKPIQQDLKSKSTKLAFCGTSSFALERRGKPTQWFDIKYPKSTRVFWLKVSSKTAIERIAKRSKKVLSTQEKQEIAQNHKESKERFDEIYPLHETKTPKSIIKELSEL